VSIGRTLVDVDRNPARKLSMHQYSAHPWMFGDLLFNGCGINLPDIHPLAQPGDGDNLIAADPLANAHLNFAHREVSVLDNEVAQRCRGDRYRPAQPIEHDAQNNRAGSDAHTDQISAPPADILLTIVFAINF
jgi:hypothetical protein